MKKVEISSRHNEEEVSSQNLQVPESKSGSQPGESSAVKGTKTTNDLEDVMDDDVRRMETKECPHILAAVATEQSKKLSHIQASDSDCISFMDLLPNELLLNIFKNLSLNTLINVAPVCKRWFVLSKDESLWLKVDMVYNIHAVNDSEFLRIVCAARHLRTLDVSLMDAEREKGLLSLLNGLESVRRLSCSCLSIPSVIVELVKRFKDTLKELTISLSDERLSYGEGGTLKDGVKPRPGFLLKLISEMKNLHVLRLTEGELYPIGYDQGCFDPKWYFGELENPEFKLKAIDLDFDSPRHPIKESLVQGFIIPFLKSKVSFLKELHLSPSLWGNENIQAIVRDCEKLELIMVFPISYLSALKNVNETFFMDILLESETDVDKLHKDMVDCQALSQIHEVSLCFPGELFLVPEVQQHAPDVRLKQFLHLLACRLKSCKRVHINRLRALSGDIFIVPHVHNTDALKKFLCTLCPTVEELHIADRLKAGRYLPEITRLVRESVPQLKARGISVNRLGRKGLLFSTKTKKESVISNAVPFLLSRKKMDYNKYRKVSL